MRSTLQTPSSGDLHQLTNEEEPGTDYPVAPPVMAKNRYGREELLALMPLAGDPPDDLVGCTFFVALSQKPTVLQDLTDLEMGLQMNINSSKANSTYAHMERVAGGGGWSGDTQGSPTPFNPGWMERNGPGPRPERGGYGLGVRGGFRGGRSGGGIENVPGRYVPTRGVRGTAPNGRGGAAVGVFNPRAKGLYDPRDPRDRPRQRVRSTGEENVPSNNWEDRRRQVHTRPQGGDTQKDSLPEWMDDEDQQRLVNDDQVQAGTFDNEGQFTTNRLEKSESPTKTSAININDKSEVKSSSDERIFGGNRRENDKNFEKDERRITLKKDLSENDKTLIRMEQSAKKIVDCLAEEEPKPRPQRQKLAPPPPEMQKNKQQQEQLEMWQYRDPSGFVRGPFDSSQMNSWFVTGYFTMELMIKRVDESDFASLGDLIRRFGGVPFAIKSQNSITSNNGVVPIMQPNIWGDDGSSTQVNPVVEAIKVQQERQKLEEEQRKVAEEQRKLQKVQESLEKDKEEREKRMLEKELGLRRQQDEMLRRQEAALQRERELETERERIRKQELIMNAELRAKHQSEITRQQEEKRRIENEMKMAQELHRKEIEEQRRQNEQEMKQKQLQQHLQLQQQQQQQKLLVQHQQPEKQQQQLSYGALPWNRAKPSSSLKMQNDDMSLLDIQLEEQRQMNTELKQQQQLDALKKESLKAMHVDSSSAWGSTASRFNWGHSSTTTAAAATTPCTNSAWGNTTVSQISTQGFWDEPSVVQQKQRRQQQQKLDGDKKDTKSRVKPQPTSGKTSQNHAPIQLFQTPIQNVFHSWTVQGLRKLNQLVDAEVFATFIAGVDSPAEVEDYMVGYLGEDRAVMDFIRQFIAKRSESRKIDTGKDVNLLTPAVVVPKETSTPLGGRKKKRGGRGGPRLVVDTRHLGFTATADPNRVNVGDIESIQ